MSTKVSGRAHFSSRDLVSDVTTSRVLWASLAVLQLAVAYPQHGVKTGRFISCKKDTEYLHNGICCAKCEAGQYVQTPCTETGKKGTCEECDYGTFTEHANGLKQCIKCTQCPPDQEIVRVCSHTQDTLCRCKPGRYCHPDEACEICKKCSRCNSDEEVVKNCTSTSNTECKKLPGKTSPEADTTLTAVLTVFFVVLFLVLVTIIFILWRKKWRTADSNSFNEEEEPFPTLIPKNGVESLVACFEFFEELNVDFHNRFFRKLSIEDNEIRSKDHLSHEDRIHYLLSYWVEKKGKEASLNHLLRALLDLNQRRTAETVMEKSIQKGFYELESLSVGDN
ncbi:tumor necrosis factor receptor superfamily member 6-like isoform X3 [Xiphophorus hellerii]|uniref:tumor necrosis factor receptor superfamily member 6-like isoform X3 n=1 Tax=Xiphophorus hellerii TaxID=8084 RepID=UPI0013B46670|nr:tumor necrosis factor receptor superfamily member 6-like isoform X3 [Xiphophorus hellerii]